MKTVEIPNIYFKGAKSTYNDIDGECTWCRFKVGSQCLLFDKETRYSKKMEKPLRLTECKKIFKIKECE